MSALTHLSKKPHARGRTIAWIELRDRVTAKLAAETIAAKKRGERVEPERAAYASPSRLRAVAIAMRPDAYDPGRV